MEPNDEVLVVIQAESGEEIALPLAALGEQHQEVVVDSDGITTIVGSQDENNDVQSFSTTNGFEVYGETSSGGDSKTMTITSPQTSPVKQPEEPRIKQKRKEKLVCLPLFEDDMTLEFQPVEQHSPPPVEETKKRPRKEYRTKKRLAALEPHKEQNSSPPPTPTQTPTTPTSSSTNQTATITTTASTTNTTTTTTTTTTSTSPTPTTPQQRTTTPAPVQPTSERRTRLSNACRVATGKMYKCNDCEFSTERINNIISHMKETCPKIKK